MWKVYRKTKNGPEEMLAGYSSIFLKQVVSDVAYGITPTVQEGGLEEPFVIDIRTIDPHTVQVKSPEKNIYYIRWEE